MTAYTLGYVIAATAPAAPETGDVWLDTTALLWKRWSGTAWIVLGVAQVGGGREGLVAGGNSGTTKTIDISTGNVYTLTLTGNCTLTFPTVANDGAYSFTLVLVQDGTGSRLVTWPAAVKWSGGVAPVLTTTINKRDVFTFLTYDGGTTWIGGVAGQNLV